MKRIYASDASKRHELRREDYDGRQETSESDPGERFMQSALRTLTPADAPFGNFCRKGNYCGRCQYNCERAGGRE